ncbi:MAG: hypothetical protein JRI23_17060 [Deltaproteobacteria bacterium]|nr:hypothetical protein [Deltaproteobacteria bacterium]MBW2533519.1 hypothetical protein [Deltaproteobacteria bacterium]
MADACEQAGAILRMDRQELAGRSLTDCLIAAGLVVPKAVRRWPTDRLGARPLVAIALAVRIARPTRSGAPDAEPDWSDPKAVLLAMEGSARSVLDPEHGLRLELCGGRCAVPLKASELERILLNLVINARDALDEAGTITVRTRRTRGGAVELTVSDTGAGMSLEVQSRAFEPLYTTKTQGTGLGLAVVKDAIQRANGVVEIESEPGKGTTIRIVLQGTTAARRNGCCAETPGGR